MNDGDWRGNRGRWFHGKRLTSKVKYNFIPSHLGLHLLPSHPLILLLVLQLPKVNGFFLRFVHCDGVGVGRSHSIVSETPSLCSISDLLAKRIKKREELGKNSKTEKKLKDQIKRTCERCLLPFSIVPSSCRKTACTSSCASSS